MKSNELSPLFPTAFAGAADAETLVYPIPTDAQTDGRASLAKGFPKETMTPLAAGGKPPQGTDFNGILKMLSTSCQRSEAGYVTPWNLEFANAIGGYPKGAVVSYGGPEKLWVALADDNTSTPGSNPTQWQLILADYVKTYAGLTTDHKVVTMTANTNADSLGAYSYLIDSEKNEYKLPSDQWVINFANQYFLRQSGGTVTGPITASSPDDSARIVYKCDQIPPIGSKHFRWGTCYLPFGSSGQDDHGNIYLGYTGTHGTADHSYTVQLNTFDKTVQSLSWQFTNWGTLQTPRNNDYLEIAGNQSGPRKICNLNFNAVDGQWIYFDTHFSNASITLSLTPRFGTVPHMVGFTDMTSDGFRLTLHKWNGQAIEPETWQATICIMAIGPA